MFNYKYLVFIGLILATDVIHAQTRYREGNVYDLSAGVGNSQFSTAWSWAHVHGIGRKKQKFKVGYGVRLTSYFGKDKDFITAPARLTSRQTGPQVLFTKTYEESLDTMHFPKAQINSLNIVIHLEYELNNKLELGFNIDAVGISFGQHQNGKLQSSIKPTTVSEEQGARPTPWNVLLVSDNDIGSLNSELYLRYWIREKLALKAAFGFLFTEYTTDHKLIFDNDRFRNKVSLAVIGVCYNPFRSQTK